MPSQDFTPEAKPLTAGLIEEWAGRVSAAKLMAHRAGEETITAKELLEYERALAYREGRIEGSNPETRRASERVALSGSFERVRLAEKAERERKFELDLALLQWEKIRMQLRLFEAVLARDSVVVANHLPVTRSYDGPPHIVGEQEGAM